MTNPTPARSLSVANRIGRSISRHRLRELAWKIFRLCLLVGLGYVLVQPFAYMVSASLRAPQDVYDPSVIWVPKHVSLQSYFDVIKAIKYFQAIANTVLIGIVTALIQTFSCAFIGYGFARYNFRGKAVLFALVVFTFLVPPQLVTIPLFLQIQYFDFFYLGRIVGLLVGKPLQVSLLDSYAVVYLPALLGMGIRAGIVIYAYRQFFRGMPKELEDSAALDGCGAFRTYSRIMLPNAFIIMTTMFLFSVVWYWNDYYVTGIFFTKLQTITGAVSLLQTALREVKGLFDQFFDPYAYITRLEAGSVLLVLPLLILYVFAQRYFVQGVEWSGIVG